jgi:aromatic-L-amino-acid decarboxylase
MDVREFRAAAHQVADVVADYLEGVERFPVLPALRPGEIRDALPRSAPEAPEPWEEILDDYRALIEPNITHWQHPGFLAYFSSVASGPGILGEWLTAGLNSNVMFWQNAPAATELEERMVAWLRELFGLPEVFDGMFTDTASVSTLTALVAARQAHPRLDARTRGLAGRPELGRLRLYCSEEAHSSVEKAAIVVGVGREGVRKVAVDSDYRMRPEAFDAALEEDLRNGWWPFCAVATLGTTSTTSVDPVDAIADRCAQHGLWLHVDAAYAGTTAIVPRFRELLGGWERADSIVVNPHKWLFTPLDASLLLFRRPEVFREAFSLVADYMRTPDTPEVHNYNEYGIQLGRRFRALKIWMILRYFGASGLASRIEDHCRAAQQWAGWVDGNPDWERLAPVPFATLCFRYAPAALRARGDEAVNTANAAILEAVNRSGEVYLSATRLRDRVALLVSIGNPRTEARHLERCFELLVEAGHGVDAGE